MTTTTEDSETYFCECEADWNCGMHRDQYTWIERRFDGCDDGGF